ncbi:hypothetical protein B0A48_02463 [Cryoendolithus antarcticus]|uniref:Helicase C-terminal domain-containing protein n=1 Tax=Cryoendolithus antarcticus TaxID=1507870 RepID=A0A1V8TNP4_9PEZI|nr:hypothetical protein B0A48_02463 [Cryoendolithus antarcticus]
MASTIIDLELSSSDESDTVVSRASTPGPLIESADYDSQTSDQHSDRPVTSSNKQPAELDESTEVSQLLADPSNFIALGSFIGCNVGSESSGSDWQDVTCDLADASLNTEILDHLQKLTTARWIRVACRSVSKGPRLSHTLYHIHLLRGDVGHRYVDRSNKRLTASLELVLAHIDVSPATWAGEVIPSQSVKFDWWATAEEGSLFSKFNDLPSPEPELFSVTEHYVRGAMQDLLEPDALQGIRTSLYPYQRRSAAAMLQTESVSKLELDPRLERRTAPDGTFFYYSPREMLFLGKPRYYEACRGGILAESMGLGKTLICLALIAATKHHLPHMPSRSTQPPVRHSVAKLSVMTVSAVNRYSVPWRTELERIKAATGEGRPGCVQLLEESPPTYMVPPIGQRTGRNAVVLREVRTLAATSVIVVPRNLCSQWHSEIKKHVDENYLNILVMEDLRKPLPSADELRTYDVILFSRNRFEREVKDGADGQNRRLPSGKQVCRCSYIGATRIQDCHCIKTEQLYVSPLRHLHMKRLIIDEGHSFSAGQSVAVGVANKLITADHRWVVSGTPAKDLLGIEVEAPDLVARETIAAGRQSFDAREDTKGAIESLGSLVSNFLRVKPWSSDIKRGKSVVWEDLIYRHESLRRRTYSGFSGCLSRTLSSVVIKTRPEDVERDIELPPFTHHTVLLKPSLFDKLTANLFTLVLTANAVTSERTDADYLFHKNSTSARHHLIANLRQSAFFWTGFSSEDVAGSRKNALSYLEKQGTGAAAEDRQVLKEVIAAADQVLSSPAWQTLSESHELGVFIKDWPADTAQFWAFAGCTQPLMTGISQTLEAQRHVHERVGMGSPVEGLAGVGIKSLARARNGRAHDAGILEKQQSGEAKPGLPPSSIQGEPSLKRRRSITDGGYRGSAKKRRASASVASRSTATIVTASQDGFTSSTSQAAGSSTKSLTGSAIGHVVDGAVVATSDDVTTNHEPAATPFPDNTPFGKTQIVGTTSAKLSYLVTQILRYHQEEKILVFYDADNAAYYVAQMLELLHITHEIYAKSLTAAMKSEYVVKFNEDPEQRVLLMDVKQAAHGLNISSASRVYFVNPVCRPNIEAQAIKRAHRIGQTRRVHVETLVLEGTIEEKMHERSKRMTGVEHRGASYLEDDDGIRGIIQSAQIIAVTTDEMSGAGQIAPLAEPQQLWGRSGWQKSLDVAGSASSNRKKGKAVPVKVTVTPEERRQRGTVETQSRLGVSDDAALSSGSGPD